VSARWAARTGRNAASVRKLGQCSQMLAYGHEPCAGARRQLSGSSYRLAADALLVQRALCPAWIVATPEPIRAVRIAGPGSDDSQILLSANPFQARQVVEHLGWIEEPATSMDSRVLATGNPSALSRLTTLEPSRAANSVSTRVHSTSSVASAVSWSSAGLRARCAGSQRA
jgi:hypothetical protein